jgi:hypothetical protein
LRVVPGEAANLKELDVITTSLAVLIPAIESSASHIVDTWGEDSLPASDAPANW